MLGLISGNSFWTINLIKADTIGLSASYVFRRNNQQFYQMKFANIQSGRSEATLGAEGKCPFCNSIVRAYCGNIKAHHWKHEVTSNCDPWFESETQWHLDWKNCFNVSQQEYIFTDSSTKEKHIADVYNEHLKLVIEFQHSPISIEEVISRETFYQKMLWVVDLSSINQNIIIHQNSHENFEKIIFQKWSKDYDEKSDIFLKKEYKENLGANSENEYLENLSDKYFEKEVMEGFEDMSPKFGRAPVYATELMPNTKIMQWKHQHKRWNYNNKPTFFDFGGEHIYLRLEIIPMLNIFIVKPYSKIKFVTHYSRKK